MMIKEEVVSGIRAGALGAHGTIKEIGVRILMEVLLGMVREIGKEDHGRDKHRGRGLSMVAGWGSRRDLCLALL
jgi:hypothetical protein